MHNFKNENHHGNCISVILFSTNDGISGYFLLYIVMHFNTTSAFLWHTLKQTMMVTGIVVMAIARLLQHMLGLMNICKIICILLGDNSILIHLLQQVSSFFCYFLFEVDIFNLFNMRFIFICCLLIKIYLTNKQSDFFPVQTKTYITEKTVINEIKV